jgi:hypothetical protein
MAQVQLSGGYAPEGVLRRGPGIFVRMITFTSRFESLIATPTLAESIHTSYVG